MRTSSIILNIRLKSSTLASVWIWIQQTCPLRKTILLMDFWWRRTRKATSCWLNKSSTFAITTTTVLTMCPGISWTYNRKSSLYLVFLRKWDLSQAILLFAHRPNIFSVLVATYLWHCTQRIIGFDSGIRMMGGVLWLLHRNSCTPHAIEYFECEIIQVTSTWLADKEIFSLWMLWRCKLSCIRALNLRGAQK